MRSRNETRCAWTLLWVSSCDKEETRTPVKGMRVSLWSAFAYLPLLLAPVTGPNFLALRSLPVIGPNILRLISMVITTSCPSGAGTGVGERLPPHDSQNLPDQTSFPVALSLTRMLGDLPPG